ncbi:MAG TPA: cation transporter, partial [Sulfurivirga caldicuralii]|nr:cation transporter [Sulfurivirga caldicuralii]
MNRTSAAKATYSKSVQYLSPHHNHIKTGDEKNQRKVLIAAILTGSYMLIEIIGGWWVGSLALMADGIHMLTDAVALMI